jgi:hypothetical protein
MKDFTCLREEQREVQVLQYNITRLLQTEFKGEVYITLLDKLEDYRFLKGKITSL